MQVQYWAGRHADPSFDASAMLHPLTHYRWQPSSLAQYEAGTSADHNDPHNLRPAPYNNRPQQPTRHQSQNQGKKASASAATKPKSPLAILQADQASLRQRKANIARFGCTWLRPAGVPKTYQAMMDEAAEREEHEAQARREAAAAEEQRAARQAEAQAAAAAAAVAVGGAGAAGRRNTGAGAGDFGGEGAMDVDLDDEVPEAEEVEYDEEEEEEEDEEVDDDEHVDEAEDEDAGARERDLDDSIPEAGSYQHTDTDVEDEESVSFNISEHMPRNPHAGPGVPPENALNPPQILDGATGRFVHSIEGTAEFMPVESPESSMLLSSPAAARERARQRREEFLERRGI